MSNTQRKFRLKSFDGLKANIELFPLKLHTIKTKAFSDTKSSNPSSTGNLERFRSEMRSTLRDTHAIVLLF